MPRSSVAVIFHRFGPYHVARLKAAAEEMEVLAIELSAESSTYAWDKVESGGAFRRITIFPEGDSEQAPVTELRRRLRAVLEEQRPPVVAVPGWWDRGSLVALDWCRKSGTPAIIMVESTLTDERRLWWKEEIKRRLVGLCSAGFVGGTRHADYVAGLGLARDRLFDGYDVVDNNYFADKTLEARNRVSEIRTEFGLPNEYFLASGRFVPSKNFAGLLEAYARYRRIASESRCPTWSLVVLGDGPLRSALRAQVSALSLEGRVLLPGFKQYDELPAYYALAGTFILASLPRETWGLVANEAMAAGLPVLVSTACGCAPDLVREGVNGFTFDPRNAEELADLMAKLAGMAVADRQEMGAASRDLISAWGPERFARGLKAAVSKALEVGPAKATPWQMFLQSMALGALFRR